MANKINERLGLKPQTRKRQATHSTAIASSVGCRDCGSHHVMRTLSTNGKAQGEFWCGACGTFFDAPAQRQDERRN